MYVILFFCVSSKVPVIHSVWFGRTTTCMAQTTYPALSLKDMLALQFYQVD